MVAISNHVVLVALAIREHGGAERDLGPLIGRVLNVIERSLKKNWILGGVIALFRPSNTIAPGTTLPYSTAGR